MNVQRSVLCAVAATALLFSAGCPENEKHETKEEAKAPPAATVAPTPAPTAAATAAATAADTAAAADVAPPAPPADKVEVEGKPPSPHHTWVHGYWHWAGKEYAWFPGSWEDETAFATAAPPALRVEHVGIAPGAGYSYLPGYWHWGSKEYLWAPGHWAAKRDGFAYTHPTYAEEKGHWVRHGFGWEKEDAAWKKKYATGWDKQGEIYVHHAEAVEFVKRGEHEGWLKKH